MRVTFFKNINETRTPFFQGVLVALKRIRDGKSADAIEVIRTTEDKELRNQYKKLLPSVLFSGTFKQRNNNSLMDHSGLICLDFDDVEVKKKIDELSKDEYIFSCWVSPSGNGVKALVKIPTDNHKGSFLALQERFPLIDNACKDVARVCYESYDPNIYLNKESKVFDKQIIKTYTKVEVKVPENDSDEIYERLKTWMENKGLWFTQGSRNVFIHRFACALNRFGVPKELAKMFLLRDFIDGSTDFQLSEFEKCVNQGYKFQGNTAQFEKKTTESKIINKVTKGVIDEELIDLDEPITDIFYAENSIKETYEIFKNGYSKAETTHFPEIDQIFRLLKGQITILHGMGNHGKSTIMFQILLNRAVFNGEKFAIYSPEQFPASDFFIDLLEMYVGKSISPHSRNQMSEDEMIAGMEFVNKHFFYVYPEEDAPTPKFILNKFHEMIVKKKVDGVVIDPYNQLEHDFSLRDDQYISSFLSMCKRFALSEHVYFWILAHPRGGLKMKGDGNFEAPYVTHLSGGMMWNNKSDNILCYHRPEFRTNPSSTLCELTSQKIKRQKYCGRPGTVEMDYNRDQKCFFIGGRNPLRDKMPNEAFEMAFPKIDIDEVNPFDI